MARQQHFQVAFGGVGERPDAEEFSVLTFSSPTLPSATCLQKLGETNQTLEMSTLDTEIILHHRKVLKNRAGSNQGMTGSKREGRDLQWFSRAPGPHRVPTPGREEARAGNTSPGWALRPLCQRSPGHVSCSGPEREGRRSRRCS